MAPARIPPHLSCQNSGAATTRSAIGAVASAGIDRRRLRVHGLGVGRLTSNGNPNMEWEKCVDGGLDVMGQSAFHISSLQARSMMPITQKT